jgi:hypothetical protein
MMASVGVPLEAGEVLNREFLEIRARLLQIAASLDRIDRAGSMANDPRLDGIRRSLEILAASDADRAERIQLIFSRSYHPGWRATFENSKDS